MIDQTQAQGQFEMKMHNRSLVLNLIHQHKPISRTSLAKITDMSPTSITRIVSDLMEANLLVELDAISSGVGRKAVMLDINKDAFYSLGIAVDLNSIKMCVIDYQKNVLASSIAPFGNKKTVSLLLKFMYQVFQSLITDHRIDRSLIKTIGISISGTVDNTSGSIIVSPQFNWENVDFASNAERIFGMPVILENDVKAAIYAEYVCQESSQVENLSYLEIGSGVGAAFMHHGEIIRGCNNSAGEIGHITVCPSGVLCDCGRRGCLNAYLAEKHILKKAKKYNKNISDLDQLMALYAAGESWAVGIVDEICMYIALALNNILCSYNPNKIIVGGYLISAYPDLLKKSLARTECFKKFIQSDVVISSSEKNGYESSVGAAIIAQKAYVEKHLSIF